MKTMWLLLFMCLSVTAQRPVALVFDAITVNNSNEDRRKYTLSYHLKNTSDKPISFFLNTHSIVPVVSSSMSFSPHYKLYKNGKSVDVSGVFTSGELTWRTMEDYQKYVDSIRKTESDINVMKKRQSDMIMASLVHLKPNETKTCSIVLAWNFQRYQSQDEIEYFLEPESNYTLELSMHLMLPELQDRLTESDYKLVSSDKTMITGWFTSNALSIDLSDKKIPANRD